MGWHGISSKWLIIRFKLLLCYLKNNSIELCARKADRKNSDKTNGYTQEKRKRGSSGQQHECATKGDTKIWNDNLRKPHSKAKRLRRARESIIWRHTNENNKNYARTHRHTHVINVCALYRYRHVNTTAIYINLLQFEHIITIMQLKREIFGCSLFLNHSDVTKVGCRRLVGFVDNIFGRILIRRTMRPEISEHEKFWIKCANK